MGDDEYTKRMDRLEHKIDQVYKRLGFWAQVKERLRAFEIRLNEYKARLDSHSRRLHTLETDDSTDQRIEHVARQPGERAIWWLERATLVLLSAAMGWVAGGGPGVG